MNDESNVSPPQSPDSRNFKSIWLKIGLGCAFAIYFVWRSWDALGFTLMILILGAPFVFAPEIIDWLLGVKKR